MIFDTLYLLFKSDSAQASKDVGELEKKIDSLREKGKKRSEQENKDLKENIKQHKELTSALNETEQGYTKIANSIVQAAAAFVSFGALARGLFGTAEANSNLQVQSNLIGQSTSELKAFGAAAAAAGGSAEDATGYIQSLFQQFSSIGLGSQLPAAEKIFEKIRNQLKLAGDDLGQREYVFQQFGVPQGLKPLLSLPDAEYNAAIEKQRQLSQNVEEGAKVARDYAESWTNVKTGLDSVFTTIGTDALPALKSMNEGLADFFGQLKEHPKLAEGVFLGAATGVAALGTAIIGTLVPSLAAAATAAAPLVALGAAGVGVFKGSKALYDWSSKAGFNNPGPGGIKLNSDGKISLNDTESVSTLNMKDIQGAQFDAFNEQARLRDLNRARSALSDASSASTGISNISVGGGRNLSVKTGDIHVNTQATDSQGIARDIGNDLVNQINLTASNLDDGVKY